MGEKLSVTFFLTYLPASIYSLFLKWSVIESLLHAKHCNHSFLTYIILEYPPHNPVRRVYYNVEHLTDEEQAKQLAQGHKGGEERSLDLNPGSLSPESGITAMPT